MITRIGKDGKPYHCKTERHYGDITQRILEVAARGQPFTHRDIEGSSQSLRNRLHKMAREGRLKIIRRGDVGRGGQPAVYQINRQAFS
jgi:hypothetical protein